VLQARLLAVDFLHPVEAVIPGAQGRILSVLARTSGELNLRTIARLAGVSSAQASRVLPGLVALGVVERREVPPSALFRLVPEHVAARAVVLLVDARELAIHEVSRLATELRPTPISVVIFGSFARGEAVAGSDIDVVVVRRDVVDEDDAAWRRAIDGWAQHARRVTGNRVELLEVSQAEAGRRLRSRQPLWLDVQRDGLVVFGRDLASLRKRLSA
jgi:predicted nucleotidyltransferase